MRRVGAALVAVLLSGLVTGLAVSSLAVGPLHAQQVTGRVRLAAQTTWLAAGGSFDLRLDVDGVSRPERVDVAVAVHRPVSSRSHFAQTLEGRLLGRTQIERTWPLTALAFDPGGAIRLSLPLPRPDFPAGPDTLPPLRAGVYPVSVALRDHADGDTVDRFVTHLLRLPDEAVDDPLSVAWVQPVSAPPARSSEGDVELPDAARRDLATVVAAVAGSPSPLTLDVTPETLEALVAAEQTAVVDSLRQAIPRHQLLAAPFVDVDAAALVTAGLADRLAVQRQSGETVLERAFGQPGDPRTWSADHPLTPATLSRLRSLGVTRLVVDSDTLEPLDQDLTNGLTLARPFAIAHRGDSLLEAFAVDSGLAAHFTDDQDQVLAAHRLLADLAVLFLDAPVEARGVVVRPPAGWRPNGAFLATVLAGLDAGTTIRPVTVDDLFDSIEPLRVDDEVVTRELTVARRQPVELPGQALTAVGATLEELSSMVGQANAEAADLRRLLLVAESARLSVAERRAYIDAVRHRVAGIRGRVRLRDSGTFRLTAREGTIPLVLVNDNPYPVRVDLVLSSEKLEFAEVDGPNRTRRVFSELELQPGTRTLPVPVRARASAAFSLRATLLAPGTSLEIGRSRFTIVSTVVSGVGIVLSAGAGLFLLLWWGRHWRTVRRGRRLVDPASPAVS